MAFSLHLHKCSIFLGITKAGSRILRNYNLQLSAGHLIVRLSDGQARHERGVISVMSYCHLCDWCIQDIPGP